jgi:hypothetical protein
VHRVNILRLRELAEPSLKAARCHADDRVPGEDPVPGSEQRDGCLRRPPPRVNLLRGHAVAVPGDRAADTVRVRADEQLAAHRAGEGQSKLHRGGPVGSVTSHVAVPGQLDSQVICPLVSLPGEINPENADVLLPHVHAPFSAPG